MIAMLGHVMVRSFWFVMHNSLEISTPPAGRKPLSFRKRLAFSLVVCGILYLAMELASYGILIYWGESWSRVLQRMKATATRDPLSPMGEYALPVMVHPYIGYVFQPSHGDPNQMVNEKFHITDYGYVDDQPPIRRRTVDKVIVAIVGGSVARQDRKSVV